MSNYKFGGIVAVGSSQAQAVQRYRLLTMGKGARCFVDGASGMAFVSNASADTDSTFNPLTGNLDLSLSEATLDKLEFKAQASDTNQALWFHCTAGCGAHTVFDSLDLVKNCVMCGTAASDEVEDEVEADLEEVDETAADAADDSAETEDDEDEIALEEEVGDEDLDLELDDDDVSLSSDDDDEDDDDDDEEDDDSEEEIEEIELDDDNGDTDEQEEAEVDSETSANAPLVVVASSRREAERAYRKHYANNGIATASAEGTVEVEYLVCSGDSGCGAHVLSEDSGLILCPAGDCGNVLGEPSESLDIEQGIEDDERENAEDADALSEVEDGLVLDDDEEEEEADAEQDADTETDLDEDAAGVGDGNSLSLSSDDGEEDEDVADTSSEVEAEDSDDLEVDLLEELPEGTAEEDLDIAFASSINGAAAYTAYVNGQPMAVATAASVTGDVASLFGTPKFAAIVHQAARLKKAVKPVLREMGFVGVKARLPVSSHVSRQVDAGIATARADLEVERGEYLERHRAALATSMVGITRGFFEGKANPLRESLCAALASAGVRNPEALIDRSMREGLEAFLSESMEHASHILEKPHDVQESLSRTVLEIGYNPQQPQRVVASSEDGSAHRLSSIGTVVASDNGRAATKQADNARSEVAVASAQSSSDRIRAAVAGLGAARR